MSFAGFPLATVVFLGAFLVLAAAGAMGYRRALVAAAIACYPATLVFQNFPWFAPTTAGAAIGLWAGCFAVCLVALRGRVAGAEYPRFGGTFAGVAAALALVGLLVFLHVAVLPLATYFDLPPFLAPAASYPGLLAAAPIVLALLRII